MKRIYLVRHGEPDNPQGIVYGRLPGFGLTEKGREEARKAGNYLRRRKARPEVIFSSPLLRTRQTAEIIASFFPEVKIKQEGAIIEVDFGWWVGKKEADLRKTPSWQTYVNHPEKLNLGEGLAGAQRRAVAWFKKAVGRFNSEAVIVSHENVIRPLILHLEKRPLADLQKITVPTGSVTTLLIADDLSLLKKEFWHPNAQD